MVSKLAFFFGGGAKVLRPNMCFIFHIDMFIVLLDSYQQQAVPMHRLHSNDFLSVGRSCSLPVCYVTTQIFDQNVAKKPNIDKN